MKKVASGPDCLSAILRIHVGQAGAHFVIRVYLFSIHFRFTNFTIDLCSLLQKHAHLFWYAHAILNDIQLPSHYENLPIQIY